MKGEKGEAVELTLSRENKGSFDVKAVRDEIEMVTVKKEMIDSQVGYIQVTMFDENTSSNFQNAIKDLKSKGMKSLNSRFKRKSRWVTRSNCKYVFTIYS